jgi:subtilase family serine protease
MIRICRFLAKSVLVCGLLWGSISGAQVSEVSPRIVRPINEQLLTTLQGNVSAAAQPQYDRGEAAGITHLADMRIVLARSTEQQAALDRFEQELQEKSSPNYHKWLTPDQFGKLYGPADSDMAAIEAWLQSHGLTVESVSPGRTNIAFSGTVSQVEEALHTSIHSYRKNANGEQFYSNTTNPAIPSALAPVIDGIAHLNTIRPKPLSIPGKGGVLNPKTKRFEPASIMPNGRATPEYSDQSGYLYIGAADAATIYDTPNPILNPNYSSSTKYDGTGVTIGIGSDALVQGSIVQTYRSKFLGNSTAPVITNVDGLPSASTSQEAYLDTEIAGALAPGARIHLYAATDLNTAIERAITDNTIDILSLSYEQCEQNLSTADNSVISGYWKQAAAQGIAVTVGSGDAGSAGCDPFVTSTGSDTPQAMNGLKVSGYASTPYNIAVGGTDFPALANDTPGYVSSTNGSYYRTALRYIPESTWNDSTQVNTTISNNVPWDVGLNPYPDQITAAGGGASNCSTNKTQNSIGSCVSGYAKPAWQRGTGVPADGARDLPDVALMAGNGHDSAMNSQTVPLHRVQDSPSMLSVVHRAPHQPLLASLR